MSCCTPGSDAVSYRGLSIPMRPVLSARTLSLQHQVQRTRTIEPVKHQSPEYSYEAPSKTSKGYSPSILKSDDSLCHGVQTLYRSVSSPELVPTISITSILNQDACPLLKPSLNASTTTLHLPAIVIREQVDKFIFGGPSVGDSLNLVITPTVFDELCLHLDAKARYTYDYSTRRLLIHRLPTYYHEVSDPLVTSLSRSFDTHLMPQVNSYMTLANLASSIVWHGGRPSIRMVDREGNKKAEKVPDASIRMHDRRFPTVVVEVGKTQSLRSLRAAGKLWFAHSLEIPGTMGQELNMGNLGQVEKPPGIELVILVDFAKGARTQEHGGEDDGEDEEQHVAADDNAEEQRNATTLVVDGDSHPTEPRGKDFTHIYLELWRRCNPSYCHSASRAQGIEVLPPGPQTRSSTSGLQSNPHMCQRLQIYPPLATADQGIATFYLTDFVGSDSFEDPDGTMHMDVPTQIFGDCVETISGYILNRRQGRRAVIRMDDLKKERLELEQSIPAGTPGDDSGKENVPPLERVLVEKVNFLGEEAVGRRRKAANVRIEVDKEIEQGEDHWEGSGAVKRRRM